jgi:hypothetical protein
MWLKTLPPRPRAQLFDRVVVASTMSDIVGGLKKSGSRSVAYLLSHDAPAAEAVRPGEGPAGSAALARLTPEHISAEVNARATSVLALGEHFDPGWTASIDGRPASAVPVDGAIEGVVVPPGRHSVDLRFRPTGVLAGIAVALAALAAIAVTKHVRALTFSVTAGAGPGAKTA